MKELILSPLYLCLLLLICITYLLLLFSYAKQKKIATRLENTFFIFFLLSLTGVIFFPFTHLNPSALAGADKTIISTVAQLSIYSCAIFILNSHFRNFFQHTTIIFKNSFLGILIFYSVLSAFWSETPIVTLKYSIVLLGTSAFAAHFGARYSWQQINDFLRWSNTFIALLSTLVALVIPSIGVSYDKGGWNGILPHPNPLGFLMVLNIVLWYLHVTDKPHDRMKGILISILSFIVLISTSSVAAIFGFIFFISLLLVLQFIKRASFNQAFIIIIFFLFVNITITTVIIENLENILSTFGRDTTFTGRTEFWPQVLEAIKQRPLLGYGYEGFWQPWRGIEDPSRNLIGAIEGGFIPTHSHNGFLDLLLDLGLVGLGIFVLSYLHNISQAILYLKQSNLAESVLPLILLIFIVVKNFSESGLWEITSDFFIYVLLTVRLNTSISINNQNEKQNSKISLLHY